MVHTVIESQLKVVFKDLPREIGKLAPWPGFEPASPHVVSGLSCAHINYIPPCGLKNAGLNDYTDTLHFGIIIIMATTATSCPKQKYRLQHKKSTHIRHPIAHISPSSLYQSLPQADYLIPEIAITCHDLSMWTSC